jgi:DHA2 family methylenomycin A resistance protein-like MFS transporter
VSSVNPQDGGPASGVSSTARQIGAILGVAVLGAIVRTRQTHGATFETGLDTAFLAAGIVTAASAILTGLWLVRKRLEPPVPPRTQASDSAQSPATGR